MVPPLPISLVWAIWLAILLVELATPPDVVLGILYGVPLLLGASQRTGRQAWRFLLICCAVTLVNLLLPRPIDHNLVVVLVNRLLVCSGLAATTALVVRNQTLQQQRTALNVELAETQLSSDVIATLAHDLKTPVLGTLASLTMLEKGPLVEAGPVLETGPVVEAIRNSQQRCLRLINDLLEVFRAEQEGLQMQLQACNLLAIAQEAVSTVEPIAAQRQITLVLRQPQAGLNQMALKADPSLLRRLIENLLLNAVHHSLRGQRVWLQLSHQPGSWQVDVRDGGAGFPPEDLAKLFQRFSQTGSGARGTGLGLYLCRLISAAHGGSISASNCPGGGARVVVQLPEAEV
jgi:two-component system NarL family sensor kinase